MPGGDDGDDGGGLGPSDGSWGPQNADALGNSQYGGTYDAQGRVQVGSMGLGSLFGGDMAPGEQPGHFDFRNVQATPATPYKTEYEGGMMTGWGVNPDVGARQTGIADSMERMHGGGVLGNLGRGIGSLFGVAADLTMSPDKTMGYTTSVNPGTLLGNMFSPVPGVGTVAGMAWDALGIPKPGYDTFPGSPQYDTFASPTLSAQINDRVRR